MRPGLLGGYISQYRDGGISDTKAQRSRSSNAEDLGRDVIYRLIGDEEPSSWRFSLALVILTGMYGGVHMPAWQFEFANLIEKWLLRSSCIYIAPFATPLVLIGFLLKGLNTLEKRSDWWPPSFQKRRTPRRVWRDEIGDGVFCKSMKYTALRRWLLTQALFWLNAFLLMVEIAAYIFARVSLIFESFISLQHVPTSVHAAVPWANYIPRF